MSDHVHLNGMPTPYGWIRDELRCVTHVVDSHGLTVRTVTDREQHAQRVPPLTATAPNCPRGCDAAGDAQRREIERWITNPCRCGRPGCPDAGMKPPDMTAYQRRAWHVRAFLRDLLGR